MRIIAGAARGTQLFAPKGQDTRPTQDRVKESLFNILRAEVEGATVLDLFAGSGALALEALSRGAAKAALVDRDREAMACIRRNVEKLRFEDRTELLFCDWTQALPKLRQSGYRFDLVFLDPPYKMTEAGEICQRLYAEGLLKPDALTVVEHRAGAAPALDAPFETCDARVYRDTEVHFYRLG